MNISYNRLLLFYRVEQHVFQIAQKIGHALYVTQLCRAILTHFPIFRKSQMKTNFVNVGPQNCQLPGGNGSSNYKEVYARSHISMSLQNSA